MVGRFFFGPWGEGGGIGDRKVVGGLWVGKGSCKMGVREGWSMC